MTTKDTIKSVLDWLKTKAEAAQSTADACLPLSGGTMTGDIHFNNGYIHSSDPSLSTQHFFFASQASDGTMGATLALRTKESTYSPGCAFLESRTEDGEVAAQLQLLADGTASINSTAIERVSSSGTYYIRFYSGLQICWGSTGSSAASGSYYLATATFPVAFVDTAYRVTVSDTGSARTSFGVTSRTTTGFSIYTATAGQVGAYIAVGNWK